MPPLVEMKGITKIYPNGVVANDGVNFAAEAGTVHALVGENGAGKTTLMKILYGLEQPTAGTIYLRGQRVEIKSPLAAIRLGIGMVHQNFMLVPGFTVAENLVLGQEPARRGFLDREQAVELTRRIAAQYGLPVDPKTPIDTLPVGMRQRVEILKALHRGAELLILDEPTAVLTPQETQELFRAVRELVARGKTVIFITHKLKEVMAVSDRVTVLRRGRAVGTVRTAETSEEELAQMMVGRKVFFALEKPPCVRGERVLTVRDLHYVSETGHWVLRGISFHLHEGEILGIAGVEGNGQSELVEILTGLRRPTAGTVEVDGRPLAWLAPRAVREAGVAHIPEDRLKNGVALEESIADNLIVDRYYRPPFTRYGVWLDQAAVRAHAVQRMREFDVRAAGPHAPVRSLSGGNMQKVVLARELSSRPRVLIAAQPTRGIDIGAAEFVRQQLLKRRSEGLAILLVSADLAEVLSLSDRLAVMYNGKLVAAFDDPQALSEEEVGLYMLGVQRQDRQLLELRL